jgi:DNA polymerase-3 subunit gamma/tau
MAYLCRQEGIEITTESLESIAKEADGSMRDALSLLDQVLTSSEHRIEHEQLLNILGVVDRQVMFSISEAILHKDINTLLDIIDHIHDRGHDIKKLYSDLIEHVRNLLVVKLTNGNEALLNIPSHEIPVMTAQVADVPEPSLSGLLNVLIKEESSVKFSSHPRIALEMVLIQLHQIRPVLSIDSLIEKLEGLKNAIDSGQPIAEETIPYPEGEPPSSPADQPLDSPSLAETQLKVSEKQPEPPPSSVNPAETEIPPLREQDIPPVELENASKEETSASESPEQFHHQMMDVLKKDHPSLAAGLANSRLQYVNDQHIGITVTGSPFTVNRIKSQKCMDILQNVCCNLLGKSVTIDIMVSYSAETEYKSKRKQNTRSSKKAISHPLVADTLEIFGGNVVDVKILQEH